eukprot:jgi/Ulvmu1/12910/UM098_0098.1
MKEWVRLSCLPPAALTGAEGHACASCNETNGKKKSYPTVSLEHRAQFPNHVFHADLLHVAKPDLDRHLYVLAIIDDKTRYAFISLLKIKDQAMHYTATIARATVILDRPVVWLRTDNGGEFFNQARGRAMLETEWGVSTQRLPAGCHQSNGVVKRFNETIIFRVHAMMHSGNIPLQLWGEIMRYAVHIYNMSPHSYLMQHPLDGCTVPHMAYMQDSIERLQSPVKALVPPGTPCVAVKTKEHLGKTENRGLPGVILGTCGVHLQYRLLVKCPDGQQRVQLHRHVIIEPVEMRAMLDPPQLPDVAHYQPLISQSEPAFLRNADITGCVSVASPFSELAPLLMNPFMGEYNSARVFTGSQWHFTMRDAEKQTVPMEGV